MNSIFASGRNRRLGCSPAYPGPDSNRISGSLKRDMTCSPTFRESYPVELRTRKIAQGQGLEPHEDPGTGPKYTVWLQGKEVMNYDPHRLNRKVGRHQLHGNRNMGIDYKGIVLKELSSPFRRFPREGLNCMTRFRLALDREFENFDGCPAFPQSKTCLENLSPPKHQPDLSWKPPGLDRGGKVAEFLEDMANSAGIEVRRQAVLPGRKNAIARISPLGKTKHRVKDSHLDAVPAPEKDFTPRIKQGKMHGRELMIPKDRSPPFSPLLDLAEKAAGRRKRKSCLSVWWTRSLKPFSHACPKRSQGRFGSCGRTHRVASRHRPQGKLVAPTEKKGNRPTDQPCNTVGTQSKR